MDANKVNQHQKRWNLRVSALKRNWSRVLEKFEQSELDTKGHPSGSMHASANELCSPGMCHSRMSKSFIAERNHSSLKQLCMNESLVEPALMMVTAASLSHEMMNCWCCKMGAQIFTATMIVKSSNAEMWVAAERTKLGKANVMDLSRQVTLPRTMQASVLKRKLAKSHSCSTTENLAALRKLLVDVLHVKENSQGIEQVRQENTARMNSRNSLIVKCSHDSDNCNSSDNSRSRESRTRKVKSLVSTRMPKQTISTAGGESFSGDEAKPNKSKRVCRVAKAVLARAGTSAP